MIMTVQKARLKLSQKNQFQNANDAGRYCYLDLINKGYSFQTMMEL